MSDSGRTVLLKFDVARSNKLIISRRPREQLSQGNNCLQTSGGCNRVKTGPLRGLAHGVMAMPRNEPRISLQDSRHAHQEDDLSAPASPDQEDGSRTIEIKRIDIKRIIVDAERRSLQAERVKEISDSIRKIGLKTPVTVRLIDDGNVVLVSGLHRLQAAKSLGWDQIDAVYLDGDKRQARLWQISENLHRADLTVLERDEHIAEWLRLIDNSENISGQNVRRSRGRPEGGISLAARVLPVGGKSIEARRKSIERASQVDGISPEAQVTAT